MAKELFAPEVGKVAYREVDDPPVGSGQVRVRSEFGAFKHGTELTMFRNSSAFCSRDIDPQLGIFVDNAEAAWAPCPLGNMIVGRIVEIGPGVDGLDLGDRVCSYGSIREMHVWGAAGLWRLPETMNWKSATCLDPADFALAAVRDGHIRAGDDVALFGLGAIGLFIIQLARLSGARRVIGVDPIAARRKLATRFGADLVLDPQASDAGLENKRFCDSRGADVALDASGSYPALHHAIRGVAFGGNVVALAWPKECKGGLDFGQEAHFNRPNIIFARACSNPNRDHPRWDERRLLETLKFWLEKGALDGDPIVDPVVPFDKAGEAWLNVDRDPTFSVKLGVSF